MEDQVETQDEQGFWSRAQKPLPVQRILKETGQNRRNKPTIKVASSSPKQSMHDKENVQVLTKIAEKRLANYNTVCVFIPPPPSYFLTYFSRLG